MNREFLDKRVAVKVGDITQEETGAIVKAANSTLLGGGGVDDAIHQRGNQILEECRAIRRTKFPNGVPTGEAVITGGGNLTAKFVIHTVGPIYSMNQGKDAELLADCYTNCLLIAAENNLQTIAFPSISTGAFAYPKHEAAVVSSEAIKNFLSRNETIQKINLVFFQSPTRLNLSSISSSSFRNPFRFKVAS